MNITKKRTEATLTINQLTTDFQSQLSNDNFVLLSSNDIDEKNEFTHDQIEEFKDFWNYLELDPYMPDGGKYRMRRIGYLSYNLVTKSLEPLTENVAFVQSKSINKFVGDVERVFEPSKKEFLESKLLESIIKYVIENVLTLSNITTSEIKINVHQMRIKASYGAIGLPTPEGIHQDGHKFVSQHLISRKEISGGISGLYDLNEDPLIHKQLFNFLDTIVVSDEHVKHDVSPIYSFSNMEGGYRDMLIIDYNL
ncbi:2OG-Fe dioxygenase family protein [uncultured Aquimarina sp.]|uniref:2OG-Fe dioxygenase family protein n=1 Tax=uncultured Aquimarina sp. TaxID=575652 RepID=UPI002617B44D|nr:2OG-Fe dioxygenase family protein [uncultured Aquimarina sp.]